MLLIVPYHGMRFLMGNGEDFTGFGFTAFWLHLWRMGLFFAVSGFLGAMTLASWGPAEQVRRRLVRLGVPLVIGMLTILPLQRLLVVWNLTLGDPPGSLVPRQATFDFLFGLAPGHLWFLEYLLVLNLVALPLWLAVRRSDATKAALDRSFRRLLTGPLLFPVLAAVCATLLWTGSFPGAPNGVAKSPVPDPSAIAFYAIFFLFGWMLWRNGDLLPRVERDPWSRFTLGVAAGALAWFLSEDPLGLPGVLTAVWTVSFAAGFASWFTLFGVWGLFARYLPAEKPVIRYMADAAYWVYLMHFVFLIFFQRLLIGTGLGPLLKLGLATGAATGLALLTYGTLVRYTPIGRVLHGVRERPVRNPVGRLEPSAHPAGDT